MRFTMAMVAIFFLCARSFAAEYRPNELLVKFKHGIRRSSGDAIRFAKMTSQVRGFDRIALRDGEDMRSAIERLRRDPRVEHVQPNYVIRILPVETNESIITEPPRSDWLFALKDPVKLRGPQVWPPVPDPELGELYAFEKIRAHDAWRVTRGSQKIIVAVADTGVDYNHDDLNFNLWRDPRVKTDEVVGWDFVANDALPYDDHLHGTHVAGTIGAVGGDGNGISGVCQRVSIMALKFLDAEGEGDTVSAVKAIDYAVENGARIINASWGGPAEPDDELLLDAIRRAEAKGVLFVAAAGNESSDNDLLASTPATFELPNIISVAATDSRDRLADFSNFGKKSVHLAAPGVNIYSATPGGRYGIVSGTSMAAPHVTGAAALLWAAHPEWTYAEVKAKLLDSVDRVPSLEGKTVTGGRLNIGRALGAVKPISTRR